MAVTVASESALAAVLQFLSPNSKLQASQISQEWYDAARHIEAWVPSLPFVPTHSMWKLPSPAVLYNMAKQSSENPLCQAIVSFHQQQKSVKNASSSKVVLDFLKEFEALSVVTSSYSDVPTAEMLERLVTCHLRTVYYPALLWVLLCSDIPEHASIAKSQDTSEDEGRIPLWEVALILAAFPEGGLPSKDLGILSLILAAFDYFQKGDIDLTVLLNRRDLFDVPLIVVLGALEAEGFLNLSRNDKRHCLVRRLLCRAADTLNSILRAIECHAAVDDANVAQQMEVVLAKVVQNQGVVNELLTRIDTP